MKDEKAWDYTICNIGHPCKKCLEDCGFRKPYSRDNDQDEKERKENESVSTCNEARHKLWFH